MKGFQLVASASTPLVCQHSQDASWLALWHQERGAILDGSTARATELAISRLRRFGACLRRKGDYESSCLFVDRGAVVCCANHRCRCCGSTKQGQALREAAQPGSGMPEGRKHHRPAKGSGTDVHTDD